MEFPAATKINKIIAKDAFYQKAKVSGELRELFIRQINRIRLANVLRESTLNIHAGDYNEINIFEVELADFHLDSKVIQTLDSVLPRPTIFIFKKEGSPLRKIVCGYKLPNSGKVEQYFQHDWSDSFTLKIAGLTIDEVYKNFISQISPEFGGGQHKIEDSFADFSQKEKIKKQIAALTRQIAREPAIAKKQQLAKQRALLQREL
jgi:hypothetical protein